MLVQARQRAQDVVAQPRALLGLGVDDLAVEPEAAGLEAVEGVDEIVVLGRLEGALLGEAAAQALQVAGQRGSLVHRQRRVTHAQLDRAVLGLGADVPVEVLHRLHDAGGGHLVEVGAELVPVGHEGRTPRQREGKHRVEPRRVEAGVLALHIGRAGRQRDEVRHVAAQGVQQPQRLVAVGAADVHMLAEHRELLGQVAVELVDVMEALAREDLLATPVLEGVGPAAGDRDVEPAAGARELLAHVAQLGAQRVVAALDRAADLDHAARDLGLDVPGAGVPGGLAQQVLGLRGEVVVVRAQQLQLELDAQAQRLRRGEGLQRHRLSPSGRPRRPARAGPAVPTAVR